MKEIRNLINKIDPYINGKLVTHVTQRYWKELVELLKDEG